MPTSSFETPTQRWDSNARNTFLACVGSIVFAEIIIMVVMNHFLQGIPVWIEVVADALLLGTISAPVIWMSVVSPALQARHRAVALADNVLSSMTESVIKIDDKGNILAVNDSTLAEFGYSRPELLGKNVSMLMPEPFASTHDGYLASYLSSRKSNIIGKPLGFRPRLTGAKKDGSTFPMDLAINEITEGDKSQFIGIIQDLTEIEAARFQAESANKAKSSFLANMSHEIRTPLNGVLGFVQLLQDQVQDPTQQEYLEIIQSSSETLLAVLNDILDYSKIEANKLEIEKIPFDLRKVLEISSDLFAAKAHEKNLEFLCSPNFHDSLWVEGDATRISQILSNLISNATKFTEQGEIEVAADVETKAGLASIKITVRDTGIGIPDDRLKLLFRDFSQADSSTNRRFGGTGLGLAISRQLANLMGGDIKLDSSSEEGSTFALTLELPICKASQQAAPRHCGSDVAGRILIVDDNATNRKLLQAMLKQLSCESVAVESAGDAVDWIHAADTTSRPFDIALVDAVMPDKDGIDLARSLHAMNLKHCPSLTLLTSLGKSDLNSDERSLFGAILEKPIKIGRLAESIGVPCEKRTNRQGADASQATEQRLSGLNLLIAEDHAINRKLVLALLHKEGAKSHVAENGAEALDAWRRENFDLILMDIQMPVMDGMAATQQIRAEESEGDHQPILALTASAMEGDERRFLAAGMDGHLTKPIDRNVLVQMICEHVGRKKPIPNGAERETSRDAPPLS